MAASSLFATPEGKDELLVLLQGEPVNLILMAEGLSIVQRRGRSSSISRAASSLRRLSSAGSTPVTFIPYLHVLSCTCLPSTIDTRSTTITLSAIVPKSTGSPESEFKLWNLVGEILDTPGEEGVLVRSGGKVEEWCRELERRAYGGKFPCEPKRRLRVFVNPFGGKGKAKQVWEKIVLPIFEAAGCSMEIHYTGASSTPTHAMAIAQSLALDSQDVLVCVSGDGIVHELLNGLASRPDALAALRIPISPIPAGSGNALSVNLNGPAKATDYAWAALAAIKGTPMPFDLCSISQGKNLYWAFLSQAFGVMADIDLGTEDMRWLGDTRFTVGYIQAVLAARQYPIEFTLKLVESSKEAMAASYNATLNTPTSKFVESVLPEDLGMPKLKFGTVERELPECTVWEEEFPKSMDMGWHTLRTPVQSVYAGKLPFVAKEVKMFPPARNDGLIDIAAMEPTSRIVALSALDGAETGKIFRSPHTKYYKCEVYRLTPLSTKGYISVDGESVPLEPIQVECHGGLARVLSITGQWYSEVVDI